MIAGKDTTVQGIKIPDVQAGAATPEKASKSGEPKFQDVWNQIQAKYGAKPEKQREIHKTLDKDDFLKLMVTQMKNQDPTKPYDADKMATELAQITSVEQLKNVNQNITKLADQNRPMERLAMTSMIGKVVTLDRSRFDHVKDTNESLTFNLPEDASSVKVSVISSEGETVYEKELGATTRGEQTLLWDGKKKNTLPANAGSYVIRVDARGDKGQPLHTETIGQARIIGVSLEGQEPVFLVGDAKNQVKIPMKSIMKVEMQEAEGMSPIASQKGQMGNQHASSVGTRGTASVEAAEPVQAGRQRATLGLDLGSDDSEDSPIGVNSAPVDQGLGANPLASASNVASVANSIPPEMQQAIQEARVQKKIPQSYMNAMSDNEKGFPSGLTETQTKGGE